MYVSSCVAFGKRLILAVFIAMDRVNDESRIRRSSQQKALNCFSNGFAFKCFISNICKWHSFEAGSFSTPLGVVDPFSICSKQNNKQ